MACEILRSGTCLHHRAVHDLESFFNVLLRICLRYDGPGNSERESTTALAEVASWHAGKHREVDPGDIAMAEKKEAIFKDEQRFKRECLDHFAPYFEDLKPCVLELRQAMFDPQGDSSEEIDICHDRVLEILKGALESLPDVEGQGLRVTIAGTTERKEEQGIDVDKEKIPKNALEGLPGVGEGANMGEPEGQGLRVASPEDARPKREDEDVVEEEIPKRAPESLPAVEGGADEGDAEDQRSGVASPGNVQQKHQDQKDVEDKKVPNRPLESLPEVGGSANVEDVEDQGSRVASPGNVKRKHEEDDSVEEEKENREVQRRKVQKREKL